MLAAKIGKPPEPVCYRYFSTGYFFKKTGLGWVHVPGGERITNGSLDTNARRFTFAPFQGNQLSQKIYSTCQITLKTKAKRANS
jgi:hypothetical protein